MGYLGDYKIMNYVYDGVDVGDILFEKFVYCVGLEMFGCVVLCKKVVEMVIVGELIKYCWK